jgi:predicted RNA-binding protein YlqC (UPF0109 family)
VSVTTRSPKVIASQISLVATEIVRSIAGHPDQVAIEVVVSGNAEAILLLTVHPEDLQEVLAQEGRILRALRTFVYAVAAKNNMSLQFQVEATRPPQNPTLQPALPEPSFEGQARRSEKPHES